MAVPFWGIDSRVFEDYRFQQMTSQQQSIWFYSITSSEARHSNGFGIYPISTSCFKHVSKDHVELELGKKIMLNPSLDLEIVQDELGRTKKEAKLASNKTMKGKLITEFPDFINYDPQKDFIFSKKFYEYSGSLYLTGCKAFIQALCKEYEQHRHKTPEDWWGELMNIYENTIKTMWQEYFVDYVKENKNTKVEKTMEKLFELKEKYKNPSNKISLFSSEKVIKMRETSL